VRPTIDYFFDDFYDTAVRNRGEDQLSTSYADDVKLLFERYQEVYMVTDDRDTWFTKIREISIEHGYAPDMKSFKNNPGQYKGHAGDVAMLLRIALTGRTQTPELFDIMQVMGENRVLNRLKTFAER